jgi:hypothetical protein
VSPCGVMRGRRYGSPGLEVRFAFSQQRFNGFLQGVHSMAENRDADAESAHRLDVSANQRGVRHEVAALAVKFARLALDPLLKQLESQRD